VSDLHQPDRPPGSLDSLTAGFTDADLQRALLRALRLVGIMVLVLTPILWFTLGWQSVMLFFAGAIISAAGIWEGRRLMAALAARIENQPGRTNLAVVMVMFVLRLGLAAAVIYVSLRCFAGSVYALILGICLALFALMVEAFRLVRS
jgi:hypothetical protein